MARSAATPGTSSVPGSTPEEIAATWDFLKWVNETPQQVKWTTQGSYLPVFSGAEEDPELQAYFNDTRPGQWLSEALESLKQVDPDFPGPVIGPYKEFRTSLRAALENTLIGGEAVTPAFDTAERGKSRLPWTSMPRRWAARADRGGGRGRCGTGHRDPSPLEPPAIHRGVGT